MSPEQAEGRVVDARSDIFSFGVVLYELLARQRPFAGSSDVDVMHAIVHDVRKPLGDLDPTVPWELRTLVEKALEKSVDDRYQSAREVVVDLRRSVRARANTGEVTRTTAAAPSRGRWWIAMAMAAIFVVGAVVGRWVVGSREATWHNPLEGASFTRLTDFEGVET